MPEDMKKDANAVNIIMYLFICFSLVNLTVVISTTNTENWPSKVYPVVIGAFDLLRNAMDQIVSGGTHALDSQTSPGVAVQWQQHLHRPSIQRELPWIDRYLSRVRSWHRVVSTAAWPTFTVLVRKAASGQAYRRKTGDGQALPTALRRIVRTRQQLRHSTLTPSRLCRLPAPRSRSRIGKPTFVELVDAQQVITRFFQPLTGAIANDLVQRLDPG